MEFIRYLSTGQNLIILVLTSTCFGLTPYLAQWIETALPYCSITRRVQAILAQQQKQTAQQLMLQILDTRFQSPRLLLEFYQQEILLQHIIQTLDAQLDELLDTWMVEYYPLAWEILPARLKQEIYTHLHKQLPFLLEEIIEDLIEKIDSWVNLEVWIGEQLRQSPKKMKTLKNILGITHHWGFDQKILFYTVPLSLLVSLTHYHSPFFSSLVLSIAMMTLAICGLRWLYAFWPCDGFYLQRGHLFQQKTKIHASLSAWIAEQWVSPAQLMSAIFFGHTPSVARHLINRHIARLFDHSFLKSILQLSLGTKGYLQFKNQMTEHIIELLPTALQQTEFALERTNRLKEALNDSLAQQSASQWMQWIIPLWRFEWRYFLIAMSITTFSLALLFRWSSGILWP